MKPADIKWAYTERPTTGASPTELFRKSALLFVGEIMRTDEVAVLTYRSNPIAFCRIFDVNFETRDTFTESIEAPDFDWQILFDDLRAKQGLVVSGFEILCYRGKSIVDAVTPKKSFKTFSEAKGKASRVITAMFAINTSAEENLCTIAQVTEKASDKFFAPLRNKPKASKYEPMNEDKFFDFLQAVDTWQARYTDEMGEAMYKRTKRFPLTDFPEAKRIQYQDYRDSSAR